MTLHQNDQIPAVDVAARLPEQLFELPQDSHGTLYYSALHTCLARARAVLSVAGGEQCGNPTAADALWAAEGCLEQAAQLLSNIERQARAAADQDLATVRPDPQAIATSWAFSQPVDSSSERLILVALASFADQDGRVGLSHAEICQITGVDRKTSINAVLRFVGAGLLIDQGERTGRTGNIRIYRLPLPWLGEPAG